jgi:hypothetical protein
VVLRVAVPCRPGNAWQKFVNCRWTTSRRGWGRKQSMHSKC